MYDPTITFIYKVPTNSGEYVTPVGRYTRSKLGTKRVVNKGIIRGIDIIRTGMRTQ